MTHISYCSYGTNAPRPIKIKSLCELICDQLEDKTLRILIIACAASLGIGIWRDVKTAMDGKDIVIRHL
jgi:glutamate racemase